MDRFYKRVNERIDGTAADRPQIDSGLEKYPDRRAWKKVSDIIKGVKELKFIDQKLTLPTITNCLKQNILNGMPQKF